MTPIRGNIYSEKIFSGRFPSSCFWADLGFFVCVQKWEVQKVVLCCFYFVITKKSYLYPLAIEFSIQFPFDSRSQTGYNRLLSQIAEPSTPPLIHSLLSQDATLCQVQKYQVLSYVLWSRLEFSNSESASAVWSRGSRVKCWQQARLWYLGWKRK